MPGAQNPRVEIIEVGKIGENVIKAGKGQYGTFIIYQEKFYNVAGKEPNEVTLEVALAAMEAKQVQDKERAVQREKNLIAKVGKKYEIRNGQYGLYVTDGKINASLPKNITPEIAATWKADQCKETIASYLEWKKKKEVAKG
jgi:DNA topoisomerase-1